MTGKKCKITKTTLAFQQSSATVCETSATDSFCPQTKLSNHFQVMRLDNNLTAFGSQDDLMLANTFNGADMVWTSVSVST
jgi:hypothetical protein